MLQSHMGVMKIVLKQTFCHGPLLNSCVSPREERSPLLGIIILNDNRVWSRFSLHFLTARHGKNSTWKTVSSSKVYSSLKDRGCNPVGKLTLICSSLQCLCFLQLDTGPSERCHTQKKGLWIDKIQKVTSPRLWSVQTTLLFVQEGKSPVEIFSVAGAWVMIYAHKLLCYQFVQLVWSILTTQSGINQNNREGEGEPVFCGMSKSFTCQPQPSCGFALLLVYQISWGQTAVCQMRDFHCGLTENIRAIWSERRGQERLVAGRQNKNLSSEWKCIYRRITCRFHSIVWRQGCEGNEEFLQSG